MRAAFNVVRPKMGLFCHAFRIALIGAILISAQAAWGADPGVPVPPGQWTFVLTRGLPAAANGWEQLVYAPIIKRSIMLAFYHQRNSEPNESLVAYNFESNSWDVLDMGGNFHTENIPEGGESQGYFDFNPNNNTIIYHCCTTGSNQPENVNHTWWYDVLGQSGRDKHTSPKPSQQALQPGGAFDAAHNVFVVHGGDSFVGTWSYDPTANTWRKMNPSGTLPDPSLILPGLAYSTREQKVYLFGGLSTAGYYNDLYVYDYPTNTWAKVNPAGGVKPSARNRQAFAYDSTNNIFLMYGGQNSSGRLNDTWVYDPSANQWTQVNSPLNPPVPGTAIFAKLSYDSDHNVFVLAQLGTGGYYGGNWSAYAVQTWLFRYQGAGPNAGTVPVNDTRSAGALNRNTVSWAKDPALATDGTSLYVGWSEVGAPFDVTDVAWPHIFVSRYLAGSWVPVGSSHLSVSSTPTKEAHSPSLAVVNGKPWASWYESDNAGHTARVYAKNWDGAAWQGNAVGVNGSNTRLFQGQSQITGAGATPYVGVLEVDKDVYPQRTLAYVRSWDGTNWSPVGGPLSRLTGAGSTALSISIAADGTTPYAAWSEYMHFADTGTGYDNDANPKIYVSSWNGTQWVAVGGTLNMDAAAGWAYDPSIAVLNGQLFVAWTERSQTGNTQVYVKMWNGSSWVLTGSGSLNHTPVAGWAYHPSLVADAAGNQLYMGWVEQAGLGQKAQVYMARYAAGVWSPLGGTLNADPVLGSAQRVSIGVFNNQPVAAWGEVNLGAVRGIYAKQWNGSSWTLLSGTGGPADIVAPSTPATPGAVGISSNQIRVVWGASADIVGVTGYYIYRGGVQIAEVTSTLNYIDTGLNPNTTYSYQIAAHDAAGNLTAKAGPVSATTFASPVGSGGSLVGSLGASPASIDLTTEGSLDWAHWGLNSAGSFNHKAGASLISNYTAIGGPATQYTNNPSGFTWTGGTPTATATDTTTGVYIGGYSEGFRITAPADQTPRTLRVYVGVHGVPGRMVAQLSDGSAPDYTSFVYSANSATYGVFTLTYQSASAGQTLTVTFTQDTLAFGNVSLQAATLSGNPPPPDFSVSAVPASQTVPAGAPASYTVTASTFNGFAGIIGFTMSGLPSGVTAGFNPATVTGSGSSILTLTTTGAAPGTYPLTVTATSGTLSHTTSVTLVIPASGGVLNGSMATPAGTVPLTSEGSADWSHWGLNTATDFNHKAVAQQISNITMVGSIAPTRYANNAVGFTWTDGTPAGSATDSTTGIFVAGLGKGFQFTVPADTAARTLKVYVGAWRTQGNLTAHLSDASAADFVSTALSNSSGATSLGVYTLTYAAASAGQTLTVTYIQNTSTTGNVTLQAATLASFITTPDFTVSATPASRSIAAGNSAGYSVTVAAVNGFSGVTSFAASGLPGGVTADFSPISVTASGASTLTLSSTAATAAGTYPVTITATSGTLVHTTNVTLIVTAPDFSVTATPASRSIAAGTNAAYAVTVAAINGFSGTTSFAASGLPSGVTADFSPVSVTASGTSTLTLSSTAATAAGTYPVTITATSGTLVHTTNVTLIVTVPDFSVAATPASRSIAAGTNAAYTVTVAAINGFSGTTSFAASGLPGGVTADFSPASVTGSGTTTLTLSSTATTAAGTYPVTITATSGTLVHTTSITLVITAAPDFSVSATPASRSILAGASAAYTVTIGALNGFNSATGFSVAGLPAGASFGFSPPTVTGGASSTLTISTTSITPAGTYPLTITATSGSLTHTASVSLTVLPAGALSGSMAAPVSSVQLTQEGSVDWAHWGLNTVADFDHKAGVVPGISNFTLVPAGTAGRYTNNSAGFTWTDGTPNPSAANSTTGIFVAGLNGFRITVPADTAVRTLKVYVGAWRTQARIVAHLSDGSAADYTDSSLSNTSGATTLGVYTLNYATGSAGQTLTVTFSNLTSAGNITLQAATLSGGAPVPNFTVGVTPASQTVAAGSNAPYAVAIGAANGFSGDVALSVSGLPSGVTADFSPVSITGSGSSTLTLTAAAGTAPGTYPLTVTGTSGVLVHTASITLVVPAPPDFTIGASPASQSIVAGNSAPYTVTVGAQNGFTGDVALSITGLPSGVTAGFAPASITTSGASTLTLMVAAGTAPGTYPLIISATSGALLHTTPVTLTVPSPDFTIGASPASQSLLAGNSAPYTVTVGAQNGFVANVALSVTGLPSGVTAGFAPASITTSGASTLTLTVAAGTAAGTYPLTVSGTSGSLIHTAALTLVVTQPPDFTIGASPASRNIAAGNSGTYTVTIGSQNGFSGTTALALTGLPSGVTANFSPAAVTGSGTAILTLLTTGAAVANTYPLTITATSGSLSHTAVIALTVTSAPDFNVSASPTSRSIVAGTSGPITVTVAALNGFAGTTTFTLSGLPAGVTSGFNPAGVTGSGSTTLTLNSTAATAAGSYPITLTASSGSLVRTSNFTLIVTAAPDFTLNATPLSRSVLSGSSAGYSLTLTGQNGFAGTIGFATGVLPSGVTAVFSPSTLTGGGTSTLTLTTTSAAVAGSYPVTITAFSGTLSHTTTVTLVVTASTTGGTLSGFVLTPSATVQLTTEGTEDWAHWGLNTGTEYNHKAVLTPQISNFTLVGTGTATRYANNATGYTWTDGNPIPSAVNSTTGIYIAGQGKGFKLIVPADPVVRTFKVYVGAWRTQGRIEAHLSDGSAVDYLDMSLINSAGGTTLGVYTFVYNSALGGQTLTVIYTQNTSGTGNVTLQAATLATGAPPPDFTVSTNPTAVSIPSGGNTNLPVSIAANNGFTGTVNLTSTGQPNGITAAFNPATVTGTGSSTMSISAPGVAPGSYPVTVTATSGSLVHTATVTLTVTGTVTGVPVIFGAGATSISASSATITWTTDIQSDSQVSYGLTAGYGSTTSLQPNLVLTHTVSLAGLSPSTTYHYKVMSRTFAGILSASSDFTFSTPAAGGSGIPVAANTWTPIVTRGVPAQVLGYDKSVYVNSRKIHCIWGAYHEPLSSEPNNAMVCYSYAENRWFVLESNGMWHSDHAPSAGHTSGMFAYMPDRDTIVSAVDGSGSSVAERFLAHWWWFDVAGLNGQDKEFTPKVWLGATTPTSAMTYDSFNSKLVMFPNLNGTVSVCDPGANSCSTPATTGTAPSSTLGNLSLVYNSADRKVYLFGGGQSDLYTFNVATNIWTRLTTTCTGTDCVSGKPPSRAGAGFAYSSVDNVFLMAGGSTSVGGGKVFADTWIFDPVALAWVQQSTPTLYANNINYTTFDRVTYDADNNVFLLLASGSPNTYADGNYNAYSVQVWAYAYSAAANYGRSSTTFTPPAGSMNRLSPGSLNQSWAMDPAIAASGSTTYAGWIETGAPFDSTACGLRHPYIQSGASVTNWTSLPGGSQASACSAIDPEPATNPSSTDGSKLRLAVVNGTLWEAHERWNNAAVSSSAWAKFWNGSAWIGGAVGCFAGPCSLNLPQNPQALIANGATPTIAVVEENHNPYVAEAYLYVAQSNGSAWSPLSGKLNMGTSGSRVLSASLASDGTNPAACWSEEVASSRSTLTVTPQIQCSQWNGSAWVRFGAASLNRAASSWAYSPSMTYLGGKYYIGWVERTTAGANKLYVCRWDGASCTLLGGAAQNMNTSTGWAAHPSLASDGTNLYVAWEEQAATGGNSIGYVKKWNGSAWSQVGGALNADPVLGSASGISLAVVQGAPTAIWTELTYGNLRQVYTKQWNGSSWTGSSAPIVP